VIAMLTSNDTYPVDSLVVSCDGNGNGSGHPVVFLNLGEKGEIECPYCSRKFIYVENLSNNYNHH
jgi:uncharacterized Zn-finger protein